MRALPCLILALVTLVPLGTAAAASAARIDREALVSRHSPTASTVDPSSAFMVGNGNLAFTADITGLQTFADQYSPFVPLLTQAQWSWHSFPNPQQFKYEDSLVPIEVRGARQYYPWLKDWSEAARPAIKWLRENPHRFSLGRLSLHLQSAQGKAARFADLSSTVQTLDLWTGSLRSSFEFDGRPVKIETRVHPQLDMIMVTVRSPLLASGQLAVDLKFPGVGARLNPDPAAWDVPDAHVTRQLKREPRELALERRLDDTRYYVRAVADRDLDVRSAGPHAFRIAPNAPAQAITLHVLYSQTRHDEVLPDAKSATEAVTAHWREYWSRGGIVDFSGSTDPRAPELERRVILSQYLMAINAAGTLPPQEEGLFSNSWNGKFHLEMHPWHAAHFASWGRVELLERSMPWYLQNLDGARERARAHGVRGAWWPKMVGPEGRESPSTINPFIMWQQPHPIYLAELIYRSRRDRQTLERYRELVFETAELLATFPHLDEAGERYVIGPPIVPVQEVFPPLATRNPTFELEYYRFGLATAQQWRERLGLSRNAEWDRVLKKLSPLPVRDGLYLATESFPQLWEQAQTPDCTAPRTATPCFDRDHPSMLGALGVLPGASVDRAIMRRTLDAVLGHWDLRQTWGWDYPFLAMTAARLHDPKQALDFLFLDAQNNRFGPAGMTPRFHLIAKDTPSVATEYEQNAAAYFPSNGALLLAVGLMVAGWDGESAVFPGFPQDGSWKVRAEGLQPLP